jgi:maltose O-acetyltransferase
MKVRAKVACAVYMLVARHLPSLGPLETMCSRARLFLLKRWVFEEVGRHVTIGDEVYFSGNKSIKCADNVGFGEGCRIYGGGGISIGQHVMIAPFTLLITANHRYVSQFIKDSHHIELKPIVIKDDVWIGERAIILPGVSIGRGAIVGAGAVVTKDIPDFAVVAGNPAKVIKYRVEGRIVDPAAVGMQRLPE